MSSTSSARLRLCLYWCLGVVMCLWLTPANSLARNDVSVTMDSSPRSPRRPPMRLEQANEINWNQARRRLIARGNVIAHHGQYKIQADTVIYDEASNRVRARGNVRALTPFSRLITASEFSFRVGTNDVSMKNADADIVPWFIRAKSMEGNPDTELVVTSGSLTTCNLSTPHYDVKASSIYIYPGDRIVAVHAFPRVKEVPVFYWPYLTINLKSSRWEYEPGLSDRDGALLGVTYHYLMEEDGYPVTGSAYADLKQKTKPGVGMDVDYDSGPGDLYAFYFLSKRDPLVSDTDGNKFRADDDETMYRFRSNVRYPYSGTNWSINGNVDWVSDQRMESVEFSNFTMRKPSRRSMNGAVNYRGDYSYFSLQGRREDRIVQSGVEETFERNRSVLPRLRFSVFSLPITFLGDNWHYRFSSRASRVAPGDTGDYRWSSSARNSVSATFSLMDGFSQQWQVGYKYQYNEKDPAISSGFESSSSGLFSLENTFTPVHPWSIKLKYDVDKRFNNKGSVPLILNNRRLGNEDDGFTEHALRFNTSWSQSGMYFFFRSGYDLRDSNQFEVPSDSRVISPLLNLSSQLTSTIGWDQFFRYNWGNHEFDQINSSFEYEPTKNLLTSIGWNYNRGTDDDFSDLSNKLLWKFPDQGLRLRSDLIYDTRRDSIDETRIMLFKRLHRWGLRLFYRDIRNDDQEISFNINLLEYPSSESTASRNRGTSTDPFSENDWRE